MKPSQNELAILAAGLHSGSPEERARLAMEIWKACDNELQQEAAREAASAKRKALASIYGFSGQVSLTQFLRTVYPTGISDRERMNKYREHLLEYVAATEGHSDENLSATVDDMIDRYKNSGMGSELATHMAPKFAGYLDRCREAGTLGGSMGHQRHRRVG